MSDGRDRAGSWITVRGARRVPLTTRECADSRLFDRKPASCHADLVPEAPLTPENPRDPAAEGVPDLTFGVSGPVTPASELRQFVRFAAGLSRQHGWRLVVARLAVFAALLGILLFILAEFVRSS
jgi:hypothetical protein